MMSSLKTVLLCLVAVASAAPTITPNPNLHHLETRMAQIPANGVLCSDKTFFSKADIQDAIGKGRKEQRAGYPKGHGNYEKLFTAFSTGTESTLVEYPIIPGLGDWNGNNEGKYRIITIKDKISKPFVGVVQHKLDISNSFLLCNPACAPAATGSVARDLWTRVTKTKGKGKPAAGASCKLPTTKKPTGKKPITTKPKPKTPKKKTKKTKTKTTKAKVPKTKGKKKGGKL